jgi:hypothetical protein
MKLKHLKTFNSFINESNLMNKLLILEALEPKVAKFYLEINTELRDKRLKEIWGKLKENAEFSGKNGDRIYFKSFELENEDLIRDYLENKGYQIEDYRNNKAYDSKNDRSNVKITKILTNLAQFDNYASELLKQYNDEASKGVEQRGKRVDNSKLIVFSKDTLDIAQMSTDRNWTSCTNVYDGGNRDYVSFDIYEGTFIAYLINKDDTDISNPDARVLIKPYYDISNIDELYFFTEDKVYGEAPSSFLKTVNSIIEKVQVFKRPTTLTLMDSLYCDNESQKKRIVGLPHDPNSEEYLKLYLQHINVKDYRINEDKSVDVFGDVNISSLKLKRIPIKFGVVFGNFYCKDNELINLNNSPKQVMGNFNCSNNQLTSLKGAPELVNGGFYCQYNQIKNIINAPQKIGGDFVAYDNQLKSLEGFPKDFGGYIDCSRNKLENIKFLPEEINGKLEISSNEITTLESSPKTIKGHFLCNKNRLRTLEGGPKIVKGDYDVSVNDLESLIGSPDLVEGDFNIKYNDKLKSLENSPKQINGYYYAFGCYGIETTDWATINKNVRAKGFYID